MARLSNNYQAILRSYPDSKKLARVSLGAEALYLRLLALADGEGRYHGGEDILYRTMLARVTAGSVDPALGPKLLLQLETVGLIERYEADGDALLQITNYFQAGSGDRKRQVLFPSPPGDALSPRGADLSPPVPTRPPETETETDTETETLQTRAGARAAPAGPVEGDSKSFNRRQAKQPDPYGAFAAAYGEAPATNGVQSDPSPQSAPKSNTEPPRPSAKKARRKLPLRDWSDFDRALSEAREAKRYTDRDGFWFEGEDWDEAYARLRELRARSKKGGYTLTNANKILDLIHDKGGWEFNAALDAMDEQGWTAPWTPTIQRFYTEKEFSK